jgi:leader peptidase (prepilin peptidase) / N-methyltransferase
VIAWQSGFVGWAVIIASPFVGSFLGLLITRIPEGRQILWGRSCCDRCGTPLGPFDLVPLLSWAFLRGRCRHCGATLSSFYPLIEIAALAVALLSVAFAREPYLAFCLIGWLMLALVGIAWQYRRR